MRNSKSIDQKSLTSGEATCHSAKLVTQSEISASIFNQLMEFALSVPDFRRTHRGNIRYRLKNIIMLIFARA